jgi:predicted lipid-binding transport protein (Tim44 family)
MVIDFDAGDGHGKRGCQAARRMGGAGRLASSPATSLSGSNATRCANSKRHELRSQTSWRCARCSNGAEAPWGNHMLGGLAAGLGLAWLANSLGLGEAFGQIIMFALLAMVVVMVIGWFMRSRKPASNQNAAPFAFQGAGTGGAPVSDVKLYRPENVGNDASARPWERSSAMAFETPGMSGSSGSMIGSALSGSQTWGIPAGFDAEGFLKAAKTNFNDSTGGLG